MQFHARTRVPPKFFGLKDFIREPEGPTLGPSVGGSYELGSTSVFDGASFGVRILWLQAAFLDPHRHEAASSSSSSSSSGLASGVNLPQAHRKHAASSSSGVGHCSVEASGVVAGAGAGAVWQRASDCSCQALAESGTFAA